MADRVRRQRDGQHRVGVELGPVGRQAHRLQVDLVAAVKVVAAMIKVADLGG
jgi:hypothetical protein